jgi:hypothetical protein
MAQRRERRNPRQVKNKAICRGREGGREEEKGSEQRCPKRYYNRYFPVLKERFSPKRERETERERQRERDRERETDRERERQTERDVSIRDDDRQRRDGGREVR